MNEQSSISNYNKTKTLQRRKPALTQIDLNHKFMQTIGEEMFNQLEKISNEKGIRVQTLLRAVIIPEWVKVQKLSEAKRYPKGDSDRFQRKTW